MTFNSYVWCTKNDVIGKQKYDYGIYIYIYGYHVIIRY